MSTIPHFRNTHENLWQRLSDELGGQMDNQEGWRFDKVRVADGPWTITLDIHTEGHYGYEVPFTRFRAPYVNPDKFRFNLYRETAFSKFVAMLGLGDVQSGHAEIDRMFHLRSNNHDQLKKLLEPQRLRDLLLMEPAVHLHVRDSGDWFTDRYPRGVDELVLEVEGRVVVYERLRRLYDLFSETLHSLCHIGSAYEMDPKR